MCNWLPRSIRPGELSDHLVILEVREHFFLHVLLIVSVYKSIQSTGGCGFYLLLRGPLRNLQMCFKAAAALVAQTVKNPAAMQKDLGSIPESGRSPGEGNGNPLQYSCLENPTGRGAWQATVHGVTKSQTRLSD